jgi:hypothetical protein
MHIRAAIRHCSEPAESNNLIRDLNVGKSEGMRLLRTLGAVGRESSH